MRIQRLNLERFGHFTDREFDFGSGGDCADFHIIYGPNEAGKTTTMEAALRLFYGFPLREDYAFKHPRNNLQVSATLDIDGAVRRFTRLPKRSGSLVDEAGTALPETALSTHLAGLSEEDYRRLLCLDDETIERGGEEIANAQGDIGRLLFSAAAGVADLSSVLDGVRDQADALWKKRGRTTRMAELKRALADVEKEIKDRDVTAGAWKALKKDLTKAQENEQIVRGKRDDLNTAKARIEGQKRALPLMAEIAELEESIAPFATYPSQLDFDPERLIELRSDRGVSSQNIKRLTDEIATLQDRRAGISVDPALHELAVTLDDLNDLSARDRGARLDLERRQDEQRAAESAMMQAKQDLGVVSPDVDLQALVLSAADIATLEHAREALREAIAQEKSEARELADLQEKVTMAAEAVQGCAPEVDVIPPITQALLHFDADHLAPAHAAALQAIEAARVKAIRSLAKLSVGAVDFEKLPSCPTSRIQATNWDKLYDTVSGDLRTITAKRDEQLADLEIRRAQAEALKCSANILSDTEADALLVLREERWSEHLATLDSQTATAYYDALREHDTAADARLGRATELGQLRQIGQVEAEASARAAQADKSIAALQFERSGIQSAVGQASAQVGLPASTTSAEWLDWVVNHEAASEEARTLRETQEVHRSILQRADAFQSELAGLLSFKPVNLTSALNAARPAAEKERLLAETRAKAEETFHQTQRDLTKREARHGSARDTVSATREAWQKLIGELLENIVPSEHLMATLEPLRELREHEKTRTTAERRVKAMQADKDLFAQEVAALARTNDMEVQASTAETYSALKELAEQARAARDTVEKLDQNIETAAAEKTRNEQKLRDIDQEVEAIAVIFPDPASLTDIDQLRQVAARAQQVIDDRATLLKRQRTILSELGADSITTARDQLAGVSVTGLEAALVSNRSDLEHAEEKLTQAIRDRATAEQYLSQVKGDGEIAALVEQKATLELQIEETAMEHLELSLGHYLASDAIRRYRDSHRSGMMTATEQCFASLTQGAYPSLVTQIDKDAEILLAVDRNGTSKRAAEMSKGTRFQLYLALRAAAHEQLVAQGTRLPFFCDDIFETFDEQRTSAACLLMETIGSRGQAIYLTHHRHVVEIAMSVCNRPPILHEL